MSKLTNFLKLFKWDTTDNKDLNSDFDIDKAMNENFDKIDFFAANSKNDIANAIKQELVKVKDTQINSTGANLQNVQFFGESTQEAEPNIDNLSPITSITGTINYKAIKEENEKITSIELPEGIELCSTQNIADIVDNTGIIHKNIKNYTLTGNEDWAKSGFSTEEFSVFYSTNTINSVEGSYILCTHFKVINGIGNSVPTQEGISYTAPNLGLRISISTAKANTVEEFKELLKNNTIKVYYACTEGEKTTQNLDETEKAKLKNLETFEGINNITSNAPISAVYNTDTKSYIDSKFNDLAQQILNIAGGN